MAHNLNVYPSIVQDVLYIESVNSVDNIAVYSIAGSLVKEVKTGVKKLDLSDLQQGMYFVNVSIEGKTSAHRIIKQ